MARRLNWHSFVKPAGICELDAPANLVGREDMNKNCSQHLYIPSLVLQPICETPCNWYGLSLGQLHAESRVEAAAK